MVSSVQVWHDAPPAMQVSNPAHDGMRLLRTRGLGLGIAIKGYTVFEALSFDTECLSSKTNWLMSS